MMTTRMLSLLLALAAVLFVSASDPSETNFLEESRAPVEPETVCSTLCKTVKPDNPNSNQPPEIECETQCTKKGGDGPAPAPAPAANNAARMPGQ